MPTAPTDAVIEHLYLHVPFCTGRCAYCAFTSGAPGDPLAYVRSLSEEKQRRALTFAPLKTLYCGGGTPSLLGCDGFVALRNANLFTFADDHEWTVELHPATATPHLLSTLHALGVNRLSIGVQSFNDATLRRCNRRHTAAQAKAAIMRCAALIPDTGIDLIAGLPDVSPEEWRDTLDEALSFNLPHLSVYALSIDEGSQWHHEGRQSPDADTLCNTIAEAHHRLTAAGYERYETSNYAKTGYACRHNLNTWHGGDYAGLGRGAHSRLGLTRTDGSGTTETLSPEEDALERALTALRLASGFDPLATVRRFPILAPYLARWQTTLATLREHQLLDAHNAPTLRGYEVLDAIERSLL